MNIFFVSVDPFIAASELCDSHVLKMVVETAQLLSTAVRVNSQELGIDLDPTVDETLYKTTHKNHPCAVWCRSSEAAYDWTLRHFIGLAREFHIRYGKVHATWDRMTRLHGSGTVFWAAKPPNMLGGEMPLPRLCMPDEYKRAGGELRDVVLSYQDYYIDEKARFARWVRGRSQPHWWPYKETSR